MNARSWVEIDKMALKHNLDAFNKVAHSSKVMAVVKSNAYGHGMVECAKIFTRAGVAWLGVDDIDEALALRAAGLKLPILVLGYTIYARYKEAANHNVSLTIASLEQLRSIQDSRFKIRDLKIHLKLETGLNRQGVSEQELPQALKFLRIPEYIKLEGVYSHFAVAELADQKKHREYCNKQMDNFERIFLQIQASGFKPLAHMADTAATVWLPRSRYDMVRIGIGLYGLDPASVNPNDQSPKPKQISITKALKLKPALSWYSIIAQVKKVKKGEPVGYNLTERVKRDSQIAIVPVGYWHGYPWSLSNKGEVLVRGPFDKLRASKKCKVIGRVCMDMMMIDVTKVPNVKTGDIVTLIGPKLSAEEVATKAGTINYELATRINHSLPRIYK